MSDAPFAPERGPTGWRRRARTAAFLGATALSLVLLACCRTTEVVISPAHRLPSPEDVVLPVPAVVTAFDDSVTQISMRNVDFHLDDDLVVGVRRLRGRTIDLGGERITVLDDKERVAIRIAHAEMALTPDALTLLLNRYVFGYEGSPLADLHVRTEGDHIVQTGTMHKLIDIPFEMEAELTVSDRGWIRIHPVRMDICSLDGEKLMAAFGLELDELLDLSGAKGVVAEGNDLLLDPLAILPPPRIEGRLSAVRVEGGEIVQEFGSADAAGTDPLPPHEPARNFIYFAGGTIRFGKLYMVESDLLTVDADESDPFDFYLDLYHTQLVSGYHTTERDYGLYTVMPDLEDVGTGVAAPAAPQPLRRPSPGRSTDPP